MCTFAARAQQPWPPHVTVYPDWPERYTTMATGLGMPIIDLDEAIEVVHDFIRQIDEAIE